MGGFLGAGKTTLVRAVARRLAEHGERVAIITNDQGHSLVDTALCRGETPEVREVAGGCFCCRYDELEAALLGAAAAGATVALAEAVGSCTDLVATVLSPLADRHPERFALAPLAVVVDPWRIHEIATGAMHDDVAYLFRKQIEEADVVLVSRSDLDPPDVSDPIRAIRSDVPALSVSGITGEGLAEWLATTPARLAAPLALDYERYAAAEARLGWANARVRVSAAEPFDAVAVGRRFLEALADAPVAHVKLTTLEPAGLTAALVRRGDTPIVTTTADVVPSCTVRWLVNARVALEPDALVARLRDAMDRAAAPARVTWEELECFRPAPPAPTHRYAFRCGTGDDASCCAAFYDRPDVRYLLGDALHPGGTALTLRLAERLGVRGGGTILDVACGNGTSLRTVAEHFPIRGVGLDTGASPRSGDRLRFLRGDAHTIPCDDRAFDAVLCECAVSTFADPPRALAEMRRVLRPGGRLAISDMVVTGPIPDNLRDWVHAGTCLARATTLDGYATMLEGAGFAVRESWDASEALHELLIRIKRRLVGAALAAASGALGDARLDVKAGRALLREAEQAVGGGTIRYGVLIAESVA